MSQVQQALPIDLVQEMQAAKGHLRKALPHLRQLADMTCDAEEFWTKDTVAKLLEHLDRRIVDFQDIEERYFPPLKMIAGPVRH